MSYNVKIRKEARSDIKYARDWYNEQKKGLGLHFYQAVKSAIIFISETPFAYSVKYEGIRQGVVYGFPYHIHYFIEESIKEIIILAVLHTSRSPDIWKNRSK